VTPPAEPADQAPPAGPADQGPPAGPADQAPPAELASPALLDGWTIGVPPEDAAAVRGIFAAVRAVDRRGPAGDGGIGSEANVLLARVGGRPVGVAWSHGADPAELVVHPDFRRRGVGTALAVRVLDAGGRIWAHANLPAAVTLVRRLSLVPVRELLQLRRSPIGTWPVAVPEGVSIRTFVVGRDEESFLGVNARAFDWHPEQGRLTLGDLQADEREPWFDPAGFFLAVDDADTVLGFHWTKIHAEDPTPPVAADPEQPEPVGEVYVVGVDPRSPVRGLGGPLTAAGLNYLSDRGMNTVMLYVEADNIPALRLYERFGFERYQSDVVYARPAD
jgi:mycothiol synthase